MVTYGIILNSPKFRNFLHKNTPSLHTLFIALLTPEVTALNSKTSHEQQYDKVRNSWQTLIGRGNLLLFFTSSIYQISEQ